MKQETIIKNYHAKRKLKTSLKYRLEKRANEILKVILELKGKKIYRLLDVGTADGLMLNVFKLKLGISQSVGVDISNKLVKKSGCFPPSQFVQANASNLPFKDKSFDVITAAALIEHVNDVNKMIKEFKRICKKNAICIITTPNPLIDNFLSKLKPENKKYHVKNFSTNEVKFLLNSFEFKAIKIQRFMISPIGMPFEEKIEEILRKIKLDFLMCNQIIVGKKR